jgi:hypothetical protein
MEWILHYYRWVVHVISIHIVPLTIAAIHLYQEMNPINWSRDMCHNHQLNSWVCIKAYQQLFRSTSWVQGLTWSVLLFRNPKCWNKCWRIVRQLLNYKIRVCFYDTFIYLSALAGYMNIAIRDVQLEEEPAKSVGRPDQCCSNWPNLPTNRKGLQILFLLVGICRVVHRGNSTV